MTINHKDRELELFLKKKLLFTPCKSQDELKRWIKVYLDLDIPDVTVDHDSTSNPMANIWDIYNAALMGNNETLSILAYASRDSFKTLVSAIIELLCILHLNRPVCHLAAIESQSKKAQNYIKKFVSRPVIGHFLTSKNEREITITRFTHIDTGEHINRDEYDKLSVIEQSNYKMFEATIQIVICTISGANGPHANMMVVDEIDIIDDRDAYSEAQFIPGPMNGKNPITLMTSSRKYSWGLVQEEIDKAPETGTIIKHWNVIDVTEACPKERHRPDLPRTIIYRSEELIRAISEEDYNLLDEVAKRKYTKDEGYWGCINQCSLFAACKGNLATRQTGTSKMLKPIDSVVQLFKKAPIDKAKAQLLCIKPSSEGLVFPLFDKEKHMITAGKMAELITGDRYPDYFTKSELIGLMKSKSLIFAGGMDHGYTHNFSVVTGCMDAGRLFIIDVILVAGLELNQKINLCKQILKPFGEMAIWPDTADPSANKTFRRNGFKIRDWDKGNDTVIGSIDIVRSKLTPSLGGEPCLYLLKTDEGCQKLAKEMMAYHFKKDGSGKLLELPEDVDDDAVAALRYLCYNVFSLNEKPQVAQKSATVTVNNSGVIYTKDNYIKQKIDEIINESGEPEPLVINKKGLKILW